MTPKVLSIVGKLVPEADVNCFVKARLQAISRASRAHFHSRIDAAQFTPAIARELQAAVHGGHSRAMMQRLGQLAAGGTEMRHTQAGMRLIRELNGKRRVVKVDDRGQILLSHRKRRSLCRAACEITGKR